MRRQSGILFTALVLVTMSNVACGRGDTSPPPPSASPGLRIGDEAPVFTLPSTQGRNVSLGEFKGHKPVLLYFSMGPG